MTKLCRSFRFRKCSVFLVSRLKIFWADTMFPWLWWTRPIWTAKQRYSIRHDKPLRVR